MIDGPAVLAAFDEQVRRRAEADSPEERIERGEHVLSRTGPGNWQGVGWSLLDERNADAVIDAQIERFGKLGRDWEWKHYSYDTPADLPERLLAHGFRAEEPEALLFAELENLELAPALPAGVELAAVVDEPGVAAMTSVHDAVFGGEDSGYADLLLAALARTPPTAAAFVALAGGEPIAAGRAQLHPGTEFASLWGGATVPAWRKRGIFRALVAARASFAARGGARYVQVDAAHTSQPTLERLGFVRLAGTTPYKYSYD